MIINEFIALVMQTMKEKKLNIIKLSKKTGLSTSYLYRLLNGTKRWNQDTLALICNVLDITIEFKVNPKAS